MHNDSTTGYPGRTYRYSTMLPLLPFGSVLIPHTVALSHTLWPSAVLHSLILFAADMILALNDLSCPLPSLSGLGCPTQALRTRPYRQASKPPIVVAVYFGYFLVLCFGLHAINTFCRSAG